MQGSKIAVFLALLAPLTLGAQETPTVELLLGDVSMNKLPFVLALDEGIYARHDVNVIPKFTQGSVDIIRRSGIEVPDEYIFRGEVDPPVKIGGAAPTFYRLTTRAGAWNPVVLGSTHFQSRWRFVGRPDLKSPEDLKGKRIGYSGPGAVSHFLLLSFADHMGWDPILDWSMMSNALGVEALDAGHVDAIVGPELHATMAFRAGYETIVDLGEYDFPIAGSSFLFDRDWLAENEDTARRLMKSFVEAVATLKTNQQATYRTLGKWYRMTDPESLEVFYAESVKVPAKPYPGYAGLRRMMEIYDSHEMRKYELEDFYDDSYVRELDESGFIDSLYE